MNRNDYERHLVGLLCWRCHEATRPSYRRQRRCPACHAKWSYHYRRLDWELLKAFCLAATAHQATRVVGCSYPTAARLYRRFRTTLAQMASEEKRKLLGELELDETYFGGRRKGNGAAVLLGKSRFLASWSVPAASSPWSCRTAPRKR